MAFSIFQINVLKCWDKNDTSNCRIALDLHISDGAPTTDQYIRADMPLIHDIILASVSQSSLAVRFTAKNGGYPGDVKI